MELHLEWLGLVSSFLWAVAFIVAVIPVNRLGSFAFNRWRMLCSSLILGSAALCTGGYGNISAHQVILMCLSGAVGICIGDVALFACFNRLGPRLSGILFTTNAFFSVAIGMLFFNETLTPARAAGIFLIFLGVSVTLYFSEEKKKNSTFAASSIPVGIAVFLGIFAGLCQASGLAIAKPVVEAGISPVAASSVRMFCAFIIHMLMLLFFHKRVAAKQPVTLKVFGLVFLNAFIALGLGMTLMLFAVDNGSIGLAAIFSSCSPVMILPIMWVYYHRRPQLSSWFAAVAVVAGTAVIFS